MVGVQLAGRLGEELEITGLGYVRQNAGESVCHIIEIRCNEIQKKRILFN